MWGSEEGTVPRAFTLIELVTALAVVAVLTALALPRVYEYTLRAKRAELPVCVEGLRQSEMAYAAAHDAYVDTGGPTAWRPLGPLGKTTQPWTTSDVWNGLAWAPDGEVYGRYRVDARDMVTPSGSCLGSCLADTVGTQGFCVFGQSDTDLDARPALVQARADLPVTFEVPTATNGCGTF